jgi:hypothetical protein
MKTIQNLLLVVSIIHSVNVLGQSALEVDSKTTNVSLYLDAASITRKATVNLAQGQKTIVKFSNLSPYIDKKSINVKVPDGVSIEAVNHSNNFLKKIDRSEEVKSLANKIKDLEEQRNKLNAELKVVNEKISFLNENKVISGKNQAMPLQTLKETFSFYGSQIKELRFKILELNANLEKLNNSIANTQKQLSAISSRPDEPSGEIQVTLETKEPKTMVPIFISYLVKNAGWFPQYDIVAKSLNQPISLVYRASIRQETKENWNNVKLSLSNAQPNVSGVAPKLKTYWLNYGLKPPTYNRYIGMVEGTVTSSDDGGPLPGASVYLPGTTIGTVTDANGYFTIAMPSDKNELTFSFLGYEAKTVKVNSNVLNVILEPDDASIEEVVVVGYDEEPSPRYRAAEKKAVKKPTITAGAVKEKGIIEKPTNVEFELDKPFSLVSGSKSQNIKLLTYEIPATYKYFAVPKIDKRAFLSASLTNWEMYNLLDGEANVYFENTYVGTTLIDTRTALDTLEVSLGVDKAIIINREKLKDFTKKQFIGGSKEETRSWKITVKNNKNEDIDITILDQVPVSTNDEIKVEVLESSGAIINHETGEVKWLLNLAAGEHKELVLTYSVKYPKNRRLYIE